MKALNNRQFNVLWRCFNNSSVVLGLPRGNIWYAPPRTVEILVRLGFLNVAGNRTRTITPEGIAAMQADDARWFAALESLDARRKASAGRSPFDA